MLVGQPPRGCTPRNISSRLPCVGWLHNTTNLKEDLHEHLHSKLLEGAGLLKSGVLSPHSGPSDRGVAQRSTIVCILMQTNVELARLFSGYLPSHHDLLFLLYFGVIAQVHPRLLQLHVCFNRVGRK